MIKAKYIGLDNGGLRHGKSYEIRTRCVDSQMWVSFGKRGGFWEAVRYGSLERFLKDWRIVGVYHE